MHAVTLTLQIGADSLAIPRPKAETA